MAVVIETTVGSITVDLYVEERPITCTNFLKLCKMKYYNFCLFHTVQSNFIAQTGDPTGSGNGGQSVYGFAHGEHAKYYEAEAMPKIRHSKAGLISMVNCGKNLLGSQFFFTLGDELHSLDGEHCVFGEVTEGLDILIQFNEVICDEDHHPFRDIRITHTVILEDPFDDPPNLTFPDGSPEPTKERLMNGRIAPDEEVDDTKGKTAEEVEEMVQKREAQARATILEIVGDIPDADIAPPENILFVCKLNPVTTDEDLEIIFGRFGVVKSCEVIRDKTTGDSLQYAFIEFEDKKACETAYFKMDNVLIDDRRIHVDFSQSVAKMRWRGKGKGVDYFPDKQKDRQKKEGKDRDSEKYDPKDRKIRQSRSRSPVRQKWGGDGRNPEHWELERNRNKNRGESGRRYDRMWEAGDSRAIGDRVYEDKNKWPDYHNQRNYERSREQRDWNECNWDKRRKRNESEQSHGRLRGSERALESPETQKERDRRNYSRGRVRTSDGGSDWRRSSKERYPPASRYSDERERYSGKSDRTPKDDVDSPMYRGETSRSDERRHGKSSHRQKREDKYQKQDVDMARNGPDASSENDEREISGRRGRRSGDREMSSNADDSRRSSNMDGRSNHLGREKFYDESGGRRSSRAGGSGDRSQGNRRGADDALSDGSGKYGNNQCSRRGKGESATKRSSDKKTSKMAEKSRQSWPAGKVKKGQGIKGKKIQKRKRYSSSSSCCSDSSCSCGSSCCSSSDDSDVDSSSDASETLSSSSSSPDRRSKLKRKRNKKKLAVETKKTKLHKGGHWKKKSSSSESSESSLEDVKGKLKHRKKKANYSSSSDEKTKLSSRSKKDKVKKKKRRQTKKDDSSEDSSEESSSSSDSERKMSATKRKKKLKKGVSVRKKGKIKKSNTKHKGKKAELVATVKKKRKKNDSLSSDGSSGESESESSKGNRTGKIKGMELVRGR